MNDASSVSAPAHGPAFDTSGYVRRARRLADLNQRELAGHLGVSQSCVARIEGGQDISVQDFARALAAGGLRLVVVDDAGRAVSPMPPDVFVDRSGRRRPAHLDVHATPERPTTKMLFRAADPIPRGGVWHHSRRERDRIRCDAGTDAQLDQLTVSAAAARRRPPGEHRAPVQCETDTVENLTTGEADREKDARRELAALARESTASSGLDGRTWTRDEVLDRGA